jgi:hypothetical protein
VLVRCFIPGSIVYHFPSQAIFFKDFPLYLQTHTYSVSNQPKIK